MSRIKIAVVSPGAAGATAYGAEKHFDGLVSALNFDLVAADHIQVPTDESCFEGIERSYLRFWDLDLSHYDGVISTKAPSYLIRHERHVCWLLHTIRVFYDMFDVEFPSADDQLKRQREFIQRIDTLAFQRIPEHRRFCNGSAVQKRQWDFNRCRFEVLHPPVLGGGFIFQQANEPFAFLPGRLHRWKRVDLIIRAVRLCRTPMRLVIAGQGEDEGAFREAAAGDSRITFLGRISDAQMISNYSSARVVPFAPLREDYGYVTVEAFLSGKPVITCSDSGEPSVLVKDGVSGFVCPPDPAAIAEKLDWMYEHPTEAAVMGARGSESVANVRWEAVRSRLLAAMGF